QVSLPVILLGTAPSLAPPALPPILGMGPLSPLLHPQLVFLPAILGTAPSLALPALLPILGPELLSLLKVHPSPLTPPPKEPLTRLKELLTLPQPPPGLVQLPATPIGTAPLGAVPLPALFLHLLPRSSGPPPLSPPSGPRLGPC
ncbi:hypothetical protein BGW39_001247, partial [Mortierella sp. 14UC]